MTSAISSDEDIRFWRLPDVQERVGLSKTEIYRRMKDTDPAANPFPASRGYRGADKTGKFWLSTDVRAWQLRELGVAPASSDVAGLIG